MSEMGWRLFTFAIITDTHIRPPGGDQSSPFPVNDLANVRARHAAVAIARHNPEFTIHLGDMVHPLPHLPTYEAAAQEALKIFELLGNNLHFVPGNHDIGDKPMKGSPAGPVTKETAELFSRFFGNGHYSFEHGDIHIAVINSSLVGSGSELEAVQRDWLEADLAENADKRTLVFSHYPPFIDTPDEPLHYDNYTPESRKWFLDMIGKHSVEAVFSGHVHQFFFNRVAETKLYCLPPTSFIRQDFSELYRVGPASEYGRDDTGKFSYALVDVFEDGHRLRVIPTDGRGLEEGEELMQPDPVSANPEPTAITVHIRHAWARATDLPYNGPMEEFGRKRSRDDYCLLRLWQMGVTQVRTPLADLLDDEYGARVLDFASAGIRFNFFLPGVANAVQWTACCENAHLIDAVEFVSGENDMSDLVDDLKAFDGAGGPPVYVGKFHSSAHEPKRGSRFAHSVSPGFKCDDRNGLLATIRQNALEAKIEGVVFQVALEDDLEVTLSEMQTWAEETKLRIAAIIKLATNNPADANFDDDLIATRIEKALKVGSACPEVSLQLDTYADIDRSYHPRNGLIDRLSNFRPAGRMLANRGKT